MEDTELLNEMIAQNPWWESGKMKLKENLAVRDAYSEILKDVKSKQIIGIIGLRQIGKTTLLKQVIDFLLKNKISKKRLFYFSFDSFRGEDKIIKRILDLYFTQILRAPMSKLTSKVYVFFDEAQKIKNWGEDIKLVYDKEYPLRFFISGSSSMNILKGSGESLVGRIKINKLYPFSFREYLRYNGIEVEAMSLGDVEYPLEAEKIRILFEDYIKVGGFPGVYDLDKTQLKTSLKTIIDLTFYRDIVNLFEVKRTDILEGLFYSFVKESGQTVNYNKIAISLKTKFETVRSYIEYLETSFIISKSLFYSPSAIKRFKKNPKIYVADNSFFLLNGTKMGLTIETCVYNHLIKFEGKAFYWQDAKKNEVDIVVNRSNPLPVEVKYCSGAKNENFKNVLLFMEEFKIKKGVAVTKNTFEKRKINGREIIFIPAWLFLLTDKI